MFHDFNPRPRKEGDPLGVIDRKLAIISIHALVKRAPDKKFADLTVKIISIHALVKRATSSVHKRRKRIQNFNPRPRKEGDKLQGLTAAS